MMCWLELLLHALSPALGLKKSPDLVGESVVELSHQHPLGKAQTSTAHTWVCICALWGSSQIQSLATGGESLPALMFCLTYSSDFVF